MAYTLRRPTRSDSQPKKGVVKSSIVAAVITAASTKGLAETEVLVAVLEREGREDVERRLFGEADQGGQRDLARVAANELAHRVP